MVLLRKPADGSGAEEMLYTFSDRRNINVSDWTSDGGHIIYAHAGDVFALPLTGTEATRKPVAMAATMANEFGASVSPNRRWIAYISNESSRQEVYVQPFAPSADASSGGGGKWTVSRGTLGLIRWRNDSRELVFLGPDGQLMSVQVDASPVFKPGAPQALFQLPRAFLVQAGNPGALADTARDLQRLLLAMPSESSRRQELSVVLNWPHITSSSDR